MHCAETPEKTAKLGKIPHRRPAAATFHLWALALLLPVAVHGAAPVVDSFTATPASVSPGGSVTLDVAAHDPDCPGTCDATGCGLYVRADLTFWSAPDGGTFLSQANGTSGSPYSASAVWEAPATEGLYTIQVRLSDSGGFACGGRQTITTSLQVQVTLTPNQVPVISQLTAGAARLFPGESTGLTCAASDPDGDPVTYSWTSDLGTVTPGAAGQATFLPDRPGAANVTCIASDPSGGSASRSVVVAVSDAVAERRVTGLGTPQRLAVDSRGELYVADEAAGGLTVLNLGSGERVTHLPVPGVTAVAVDWQDRPVVGTVEGARVLDRGGFTAFTLSTRGRVSDVAVDAVRQRYGVLHRDTARVVVYGAGGGEIAVFGQNGDAAAEMRNPLGLAFTPEGNVAVSDSAHGQVKVFDLGGNLLLSFGALGAAAGELVRAGDVEVSADGVLFVADTFQDWVLSFDPDGTPREVLGTYGDDLGELRTPAGIAVTADYNKLLVASANGARVEVFRLAGTAPAVWPSPVASLSQSALTFGDQPVGTSSAPLQVVLRNSGNARLGLLGVEADGDFEWSHACGALEPGASCAVSVTFTPLAAGPRTGTLELSTSAGTFTVDLSGNGFFPASAHLSADRLVFGRQVVGTASAPQTVVLANYGTVGLAISAVVPSSHFGAATSCGSLLPAGASCMIDVYFTPGASGAPLLGSLQVMTGAGTRTVALEGTAVELALVAGPASVGFGLQPVGTQSDPRAVSVQNVGGDAVEVGIVVLSGTRADQFVITTDRCSGARLAAGATCVVDVAYRPTVDVQATAQVLVPSSSPDTPAVALSGAVGVGEVFSDGFESGDVTRWAFAFAAKQKLALGAVRAGESVSRSLVWRNDGDTALVIGGLVALGEVPEGFWIESDGCSGVTLGVGEACTVEVLFAPWREGLYKLRLSLETERPRALVPREFELDGRSGFDLKEESAKEESAKEESRR